MKSRYENAPPPVKNLAAKLAAPSFSRDDRADLEELERWTGRPCKVCKATGKVTMDIGTRTGGTELRPCPACEGRGELWSRGHVQK